MTDSAIVPRSNIVQIDDQSPRDLVKEIAMDIGKQIVSYVEVMYPEAITATSSTFKLSLRNSIYNEIMAVLDYDASIFGPMSDRLKARREFRRQWVAAYRKMRKNPGGSE